MHESHDAEDEANRHSDANPRESEPLMESEVRLIVDVVLAWGSPFLIRGIATLAWLRRVPRRDQPRGRLEDGIVHGISGRNIQCGTASNRAARGTEMRDLVGARTHSRGARNYGLDRARERRRRSERSIRGRVLALHRESGVVSALGTSDRESADELETGERLSVKRRIVRRFLAAGFAVIAGRSGRGESPPCEEIGRDHATAARLERNARDRARSPLSDEGFGREVATSAGASARVRLPSLARIALNSEASSRAVGRMWGSLERPRARRLERLVRDPRGHIFQRTGRGHLVVQPDDLRVRKLARRVLEDVEARDDLPDDEAYRVDVRLLGHLALGQELLGRHVVHRPERAVAVKGLHRRLRGVVAEPSQPEVDELHVSPPQDVEFSGLLSRWRILAA